MTARALLLLAALLIVPACRSSGGAKPAAPPPEDAIDGPEQPAEPEEPEQEESLWDHFVDEEDGAFDVSNWLATASGFLPIAMPITEPAVGYGLAGGLVFIHRPREEMVRAYEEKDPAPPSMSFALGGYTENGSWLVGGGHFGSWDDDSIRYTGAIGRASINLDFYGVGDRLSRGVKLNMDGWFLYQDILFRLAETPLLMGFNYTYTNLDTRASLGLELPGLGPFEWDSQNAGFGLDIVWDTRDTTFTPSSGIYSKVQLKHFDESLGGDFKYNAWHFNNVGWIPFGEKLVLGLRLDLDYAGKGAPFYGMPFVVMRGIPAMRYLDHAVATGEAEVRWNVTSRWAAVFFAGVGYTGETMTDLDSGPIPAGGVGFRYHLARKLGLWAGLDFARSETTNAVYITVGNAWMR